VLYRTPDGTYEPADVYLSGNVRRKLHEAEEAKAAGQDMDRNLAALKGVLPPDVPYYNIEAKLGAPWVAPAYYRNFIGELLNLSEEQTDALGIAFRLGQWRVDFDDAVLRKPEARSVHGTQDVAFDRIVKAAMSNTQLTLWARDSEGNRYVMVEETKLANEKAAALREAFSAWIWKDFDRRTALERDYNETMNAEADPKFDGSFLTFEGMALQRGESPFDLRKHQSDAIWRGLVMRRGLYAHEVGTGKTLVIGGVAVESRRYGIAKKPLLFAHNANSGAAAKEIQGMYPGAKVLYVDNLSPERIPITLRQIANDDWDLIVVPHSLINHFGLTEESMMRMARDDIAMLEQEAIEAANAKGIHLDAEMMDDEKKMGQVRDSTAKQLVHARNRILNQIQEASQRSSR
ncbi:MAG: hypothetical protein ACREX8_12245, partial [Gammaproteobacteria bacterium]